MVAHDEGAVDLSQDLVEVYRRLADGVYGEYVGAGRGQSLAIPGLADAFLTVDDIVG